MSRTLAAIVLVVLILAGLAAILGIERVGDGEVLVVSSRIGGASRVLHAGTHWALPLVNEKGRYPLGPSSLALSLKPGRLASSEGEPVGFDLEIQFEIPPDQLVPLHAQFGPGFRERLADEAIGHVESALDGLPLGEVYFIRWGEVGPKITGAMASTPLGRLSGLRSVDCVGIRLDAQTERTLLEEHGRSGTERVMILGIDGADWNLIRPMLRRRELPNLSRLVREGATAELESIRPLLSPLIWTTIATGKLPDKHGILDFFAEDPATGKQVPVTSNLRRAKALWNILSDIEMEVCFVDWLASWPAEPVTGVIVSDRLAYHSFDPSPEHYRQERRTYPEDLMGTLTPLIRRDRDVPYADVRRFLDIEPGEYDQRVGGRYDPSDPIQNFRLILATTETYRHVGLRLARRPARLFGVYFELLDAACHLFIKHMEPAMEDIPADEARKYGGAVEEVYRYQDEILGEFLALCDEETTVIVLSDHGFRSGPLRLKSPSEIHGPGGAAADWHRLYGALLMRGPHVRRGIELERASVQDITPTILYLLGLPVASDMDGEVLTEAIEPGYLAEHPILRIATYETEAAREPEAPIASADDEALRERLAALGYVEKDGALAHSNLAQAYLERGEFEKALAEYRLAIELQPKAARLWSNLGMAYLRMEAYEEAIEPLEHALELDSGLDAALSNLAVAYTRLGRFEDAARVMEKAVELEPGRAEYQDNLGVIYNRLGKREKALARFRAAAALEPKFPEPYNNLGAVAMEMGNVAEARESFQRALALDPQLFDARYNLGLLELHAGDPREAAASLKTASEIRPRHPGVHYQLGLAYWGLEEKEKARLEWERALSLDPEGPDGKRAAARLEES